MITHEIHDNLVWRRVEAAAAPAAGTILYIHGLGESGLCFENLMRRPELLGWNQLAPDLPGYGKSPWSDPPRSLVELTEPLLRRLPSVSATGPVCLLGHSMGGVLGLLLCERASGMVDGFVNVEGNISLEDCTFSGPAAESSLREFLSGGLTRLLDRIYGSGLDYLPARGYHASLRLADPVQFHLNSRELVEISAGEDLAPRFAALGLSVKLFVAGLRGGLGLRSQQLLRDAGVEFAGFEGAGHWPFLDEEDRFAQLLAGALGRLDAVRRP